MKQDHCSEGCDCEKEKFGAKHVIAAANNLKRPLAHLRKGLEANGNHELAALITPIIALLDPIPGEVVKLTGNTGDISHWRICRSVTSTRFNPPDPETGEIMVEGKCALSGEPIWVANEEDFNKYLEDTFCSSMQVKTISMFAAIKEGIATPEEAGVDHYLDFMSDYEDDALRARLQDIHPDDLEQRYETAKETVERLKAEGIVDKDVDLSDYGHRGQSNNPLQALLGKGGGNLAQLLSMMGGAGADEEEEVLTQ